MSSPHISILPGLAAGQESSEFDLSDVLRIFLRRRLLFFVCVLTIILLALAYLAVAKKRYRADAVIQLLTGTTPATLNATSADTSEGAPELAVEMQTYVGVLTSDHLALEVIKQLDLTSRPEFSGKSTTAGNPDVSTPDASRIETDKLLKTFKKNLAVTMVSGSRLISVSYQATDPVLAQQILATLLKDFTEYNFTVRYIASNESAKWLENQLGGLKKQVDETQARAEDLQRRTGIYGTEKSSDLVLARLEQLNQQVASAEENRIVKQAIRDAVQAGGAEAISNLSGAGGQSNSAGGINALALLQSLEQQQTGLQARLAELTSRYGPNYPQVVEVTSQLKVSESQIKNETQRLASRANNDYRSAMQQEDALRAEYATQEELANETHNRSVEYLVASREATATRDLYESMLNKLEQMGVQAGVRDTNIAVMDTARVSAAPSSPNTLAIVGGALVGGIFVGLCVIFLVDAMARSIYNPEVTSAIARRPLLGIVPRVPAGTPLLQDGGEDGPFAEPFRMVRTTVARNAKLMGAKVLLVASPAYGDGKTTVAANLAKSLASQGMRTLLVDADLRERALTEAVGLTGKPGLTDLLTANGAKVVFQAVHGMDVLPAGTGATYPAELLASRALAEFLAAQRDAYDFVIVDSPALLGVADAAALALAVDATILVSRYGVTQRVGLDRVVRLLQSNESPILGSLFNAMNTASAEYRYFYGDTGKEPAVGSQPTGRAA